MSRGPSSRLRQLPSASHRRGSPSRFYRTLAKERSADSDFLAQSTNSFASKSTGIVHSVQRTPLPALPCSAPVYLRVASSGSEGASFLTEAGRVLPSPWRGRPPGRPKNAEASGGSSGEPPTVRYSTYARREASRSFRRKLSRCSCQARSRSWSWSRTQRRRGATVLPSTGPGHRLALLLGAGGSAGPPSRRETAAR